MCPNVKNERGYDRNGCQAEGNHELVKGAIGQKHFLVGETQIEGGDWRELDKMNYLF